MALRYLHVLLYSGTIQKETLYIMMKSYFYITWWLHMRIATFCRGHCQYLICSRGFIWFFYCIISVRRCVITPFLVGVPVHFSGELRLRPNLQNNAARGCVSWSASGVIISDRNVLDKSGKSKSFHSKYMVRYVFAEGLGWGVPYINPWPPM